MPAELRLTETQWARLGDHLLQNHDEHAAVLLCGVARGCSGAPVLTCRDVVFLGNDEVVTGASGLHLEVSPIALARLAKTARADGLTIVVCHSHPFGGPVKPSPIDLVTEEELCGRVLSVRLRQPVGGLVTGPDGTSLRIWENATAEPATVRVVGRITGLAAAQPPSVATAAGCLRSAGTPVGGGRPASHRRDAVRRRRTGRYRLSRRSPACASRRAAADRHRPRPDRAVEPVTNRRRRAARCRPFEGRRREGDGHRDPAGCDGRGLRGLAAGSRSGPAPRCRRHPVLHRRPRVSSLVSNWCSSSWCRWSTWESRCSQVACDRGRAAVSAFFAPADHASIAWVCSTARSSVRSSCPISTAKSSDGWDTCATARHQRRR